MFSGPLTSSLLKRAIEKKLIEVNLTNIRDFTADKHQTADDSPYGGGPGMVMKPEPLAKAIAVSRKPGARVIFLCPTGTPLTQDKVKTLAKEEHLVLLCGHYEGIDERIRETLIDEEISIGDYVVTGGELPAMVLIDAVSRMLPGVVKEECSVAADSFYDGLLDHPSYTRPEVFEGKKVPDVLLSGHHKEIEEWRRKEQLRRTYLRRPDLLTKAQLSPSDRKFIEEIKENG